MAAPHVVGPGGAIDSSLEPLERSLDLNSLDSLGSLGEAPPVGWARERWAFEALAGMAEGMLIADERGALVYANPSAIRLVGAETLAPRLPESQSPREAPGLFCTDGRTAFDVRELPLARALAGHPTSDVEIFVLNATSPDGLYVVCMGWPLRDAAGAICGAATTFRDITMQRARQLKLLEGGRQTRTILDNIPDIAWLKDRDGHFIAANMPLAIAAGRSKPDELIGLTDLELWPLQLALGYRADDDEVMQTGVQKRVEEPIVGTNGVTRWLETFKSPILSETGDVIGTTGIGRDVTAWKRVEQLLRKANDELESRVSQRTSELKAAQEALVRKERLAVLGHLAGGVAHQIRNPLAAIMNAAYVLRLHLREDPHANVVDAIRIIHDEVRHANVIITGLLDYARMRSPTRQLASVLDILEEVLSSDLIPAEVTVQRNYDEVPRLSIDSDQIHGAFFNIIRNAIDAMPYGGKLCIETRIESTNASHTVLIAFTDTGEGLSEEVRGHLFEPLRSTKPMGIGLGLITARTVIEAHGGRIEHVATALGARFEVRLPIALTFPLPAP